MNVDCWILAGCLQRDQNANGNEITKPTIYPRVSKTVDGMPVSNDRWNPEFAHGNNNKQIRAWTKANPNEAKRRRLSLIIHVVLISIPPCDKRHPTLRLSGARIHSICAVALLLTNTQPRPLQALIGCSAGHAGREASEIYDFDFIGPLLLPSSLITLLAYGKAPLPAQTSVANLS